MGHINFKTELKGRLISLLAGALVALALPWASAQARSLRAPAPQLAEVADFGKVYYDLSGRKGLILCFHGAGGSAQGWTQGEKAEFLADLRQLGYSFVCPTSLNRSTKKWNSKNFFNYDVINVDGLLAHFGIAATTPIYVVGHSNGGGFATRFSVLSTHAKQIKGVQYSNSSGLAPAFENSNYSIPTLFNYATCDAVANFHQALANADLLANSQPNLLVGKNDITAAYAGGDPKCHEFINTSSSTAEFFGHARRAGR